MGQRTTLWELSQTPVPLAAATLPSEAELEAAIVSAPAILSENWLLIGKQERTVTGRLDLLALAPDGALVLIELKRDRTARDVVAQALDYAEWVESLDAGEVAAIYGRFAPERDLAADFEARFGHPLDETTLNAEHRIVIVAAELDEASERIVRYLAKKGLAIDVLFFQVFQLNGRLLLSRTWLADPVLVGAGPASAALSTQLEREDWNGEFYASFGHGSSRDWAEGRELGFLSAGGGNWYSGTLCLLSTGDRVWIKAPGYGFVGVGEVVGPREAIGEFKVEVDGVERAASEVLVGGNYHREFAGDPERQEYFVPIRWIKTVPLTEAVNEVGMFGNQNTVCKPTTPKWRRTVERLRQRWGDSV